MLWTEHPGSRNVSKRLFLTSWTGNKRLTESGIQEMAGEDYESPQPHMSPEIYVYLGFRTPGVIRI